MPPEDRNDAAVIVETAQQAVEPKPIELGDDDPVLVPTGSHLLVDLSKYQDNPRRKTGTYKTATVDAFLELVDDQRVEGDTSIWVHPVDATIVAVVNDHGRSSTIPGHRDHRIELVLRPTDEWLHWLSRNGVLGEQVDFAEHVEDGLTEIVDPPGADLLEIAQTFHSTTEAKFRSAQRLTDGRVQVRYDEEVDAGAGESGELAIPQEITLAIAPFVGEEPYELKARLRYRVGAGHLSIGYKLDRPERVVRDCLEGIATRIRGKFSAGVYLGSPPA